MEGKPAARVEGLATEEIDGGLLVYNLGSNEVHWLDADATAVWRLADGTRNLADIAAEANVTEQTAEGVVRRLVGLDLADLGEAGVTRRLAIRKIAVTGGTAALAAPIISSIFAPSALAVASPTTCDSQTCSGPNQTSANNACKNNANCRSTSTCICTGPGGSCSSGHCSF